MNKAKGFGKIARALAQVRQAYEPAETGDGFDEDQWHSLDDMRDMYDSIEQHALRKFGYVKTGSVWSRPK